MLIAYLQLSGLYPDIMYTVSLEQYGKLQRLVCDVISAKVGKFDTIQGNVIKTGNGDIAYHFIIKDPHTHDTFIAGL